MSANDSNHAMRPQDWFGVAIRTLGVWQILKAMGQAVAIVGIRNGWYSMSGTDTQYFYVWGASDFAAGIAMLLCADLIVGIAYRSVRPVCDEDSEISK
jgi:hypothetical protein